MAKPRTNPFPKSEVNLLQEVPVGKTRLPLYRTLDARSLFQLLVPKIDASRPVVGEEKVEIPGAKPGSRKRFQRRAVYGAPTFRNVIEDGKLV